MLAPKAQHNLADAKKYFKEHLAVGDYYAEGQTVPGHWFGQVLGSLLSAGERPRLMRGSVWKYPGRGSSLHHSRLLRNLPM